MHFTGVARAPHPGQRRFDFTHSSQPIGYKNKRNAASPPRSLFLLLQSIHMGVRLIQNKILRAVTAIAAVAGMLAFAGCSDIQNREDFASALKNKTEPEVLKYAGKPAQVDAAKPEATVWVYKSRTFEVQTRRTDPKTTVLFTPSADGKLHVSEVKFD